jgi:hypothetical protein
MCQQGLGETRRVWRLAIWTLFLWDVSRLRLNLLPTHADAAARFVTSEPGLS